MMLENQDFVGLKLGLASPDLIHAWSHGQVKKPETINYRTQRPERDGLFCERIFGPTKDWECYCGKYKRERFKGVICDRCGVEVTRSKVRRERMGHIELAAPVCHIWFFKGIPSFIRQLLDLSPKSLEKIIYFAAHVVIKWDKKKFERKRGEIEALIKTKVEELKASLHEEMKPFLKQLEPFAGKEKKDLAKSDLDKKRRIEQGMELVKMRYTDAMVQLEEGFLLLAKLQYKQLLTEKEARALQSVRDLLYEEKILSETEVLFDFSMGAQALEVLLADLDLFHLLQELKEELKTATTQKRTKIVKRLEVVEAFHRSGNRPEWLIIGSLPVLPPDLRPMVQLAGGRFASSDLNDLYRRVINRNNRLKRLMEFGAPEVIIRNEKRMLQEAVDALMDNGRRGKPVLGSTGRPLKSLSDLLKGKQGRFRQNLLGKRVDYSGRSVIVVGPQLKLYQCGLPKEMALELFKPFVMKRLVDRGLAHNVKAAKRMIERTQDEVWDVLEDVIEDHPVLLNRAPTLHRLGIQAFEPVLVEGKAIQIHPLVCAAFNADFDGDQMAVHVPLSLAAKMESRIVMLSAHNLLSPASGKPLATPSQDMVLGTFYLTLGDARRNEKAVVEPKAAKLVHQVLAEDVLDPASRQRVARASDLVTPSLAKAIEKAKVKEVKVAKLRTFASIEEVNLSLTQGYSHYHQFIRLQAPEEPLHLEQQTVRGLAARSALSLYDVLQEGKLAEDVHHPVSGKRITEEGANITKKLLQELDAAHVPMFFVKNPLEEHLQVYCGTFVTTAGRALFYDMCPKEIPFQNRQLDKKRLNGLVEQCYFTLPLSQVVAFLDGLKGYGFRYATAAGVTIGVTDVEMPRKKEEVIEAAEKEVEKVEKYHTNGWISDSERSEQVVNIWTRATDEVTEELMTQLDVANPLNLMVSSGARGAAQQIRQLAAMRGLAIDPRGRVIDLPIKASFREGLTVLEYFISTHGARKGLADTALKTADAGYLTRRLVDVAQDVFLEQEDCKTTQSLEIFNSAASLAGADEAGSEWLPSFASSIHARVAAQDVQDPKTGDLLVKKGEVITRAIADKIEGAEVPSVRVFSVLTCRSGRGVCAKCYGINLATGRMVDVGEAVGIMAAQSIGEPGTQLTLRTFHTGGMHGAEDITQGLPRVEELFEARKPKGQGVISEVAGSVRLTSKEGETVVKVTTEKGEEKEYAVPYGYEVRVKEGDKVKPGDLLTDGTVNPHDLLRIAGRFATQEYLVQEVQKVYHGQGVEIHDKHIEVIVRQLLRRVRVDDMGETDLLPGTLVDMFTFEAKNQEAKAEGKKPARAKPVLLGVTKASLATDSFLSAASFQETTRVLTQASARGQRDDLVGPKENVIIGKLIPAGTGFPRYRQITVTSEEDEDMPAPPVVAPAGSEAQRPA